MKNQDMPAMPQCVSINDNGDAETSDRAGGSGLTKREMIAMHAMQGFLAAEHTQDMIFQDMAELSVKAADALLEELAK